MGIILITGYVMEEKSQSAGKKQKNPTLPPKKPPTKLITKHPSNKDALDVMKLIKQQYRMHSSPFHPVYLRWFHSFKVNMEKRKYTGRGKYFFLSLLLWMTTKKYFFHIKLLYVAFHLTLSQVLYQGVKLT